ncbi:hypothetical protein H7Y63_02370 [Polaromonas sp.]|nr:hypothetical protein [Candidatus Saccharibacteria bacterium]
MTSSSSPEERTPFQDSLVDPALRHQSTGSKVLDMLVDRLDVARSSVDPGISTAIQIEQIALLEKAVETGRLIQARGQQPPSENG